MFIYFYIIWVFMRVKLIQVDGDKPNLYLMKRSTYHKLHGDIVGWFTESPDLVYISCIFNWNKDKANSIADYYRGLGCDVNLGGTGINLEYDRDMDDIYPDYTLYDMDYDLGFTTRGCIRHCYFCVVPKKEGFFRVVEHPSRFHDPNHSSVILMDNNILANVEWFKEVAEYLITNRLKVDFNQGLDIRLVNPEIASIIKRLKPMKIWHFAFDSLTYKAEVIRGIRYLYDAGVNLRNCANFYVYLHNDDQYESALKRCQILKSFNCLPYVMINRDCEITKRMRDLKRWTRPQIFFSCDFEQYH